MDIYLLSLSGRDWLRHIGEAFKIAKYPLTAEGPDIQGQHKSYPKIKIKNTQIYTLSMSELVMN